MLKNLLILFVGLLAMVAALFAFKGLLYVADSRTALEDEVVRPGPQLADEFPAASGWAADELATAREQAASSGAAAVVVLHRGRLVAEWGRTQEPVELTDARVSVLSLLWGAAQGEGLVPTGTPRPDLRFDADRADSLAADLEQRSGRTLAVLIRDWLADPAGLTDFDVAHVSREDDPERSVPRYGIRLSPRDLARLGQLVLDQGRHGERQVVPADWVATSTSPLRGGSRVESGYVGDGWRLPVSEQVELRGRGGVRLRVDRQLQLVVAVGVLSGNDPSERAVWTVLGDRQDGGEFRRFLSQVKGAGRLGLMDPRFSDLVEDGDIDGAVAHAREVRAADPQAFLFTEAQLNALAYELLGDDRTADAIKLFQLNVDEFPAYFNTHDSLGEAYYEAGDREQARTCYERALELNPNCRSAARMLRRLEDSTGDAG